MGLGLLLAVCQTCRPAKDERNRFRSATPSRMYPEAPAPRGELIQVTVETKKTELAGAAKPTPAKAAPVSAPSAEAVQPPVKASGRSGWNWRRLFGWGRWWGRKVDAGAGLPQQLTLENLRVCANDLKDADWELAQRPMTGARVAFLRNLAETGQPTSKPSRLGRGLVSVK